MRQDRESTVFVQVARKISERKRIWGQIYPSLRATADPAESNASANQRTGLYRLWFWGRLYGNYGAGTFQGSQVPPSDNDAGQQGEEAGHSSLRLRIVDIRDCAG